MRLSPETCRVKPLRRIKTQLLHLVGLISLLWVLKETIKKKLILFERKVLRKIFGPTKERDGTRRIKTNDELDELIKHNPIINHIQAQRLSWFGHLQRMPEERMVKKVYKWKPTLTRPLGRPKN